MFRMTKHLETLHKEIVKEPKDSANNIGWEKDFQKVELFAYALQLEYPAGNI